MKLGFLTAPLGDRLLEETLAWLCNNHPSLDCVELGVGNDQGAHCDPEIFLADQSRLQELEETLIQLGFTLSALSAHGNPLHPNTDVAEYSVHKLRTAVSLMSTMDSCLCRDDSGHPIRVVNCFSGLPSADIRYSKSAGFLQSGSIPGWNVCPWPDEHADSYRAQMEYAGSVWRDLVREARDAGVGLGIEWHPNFLVHNTETYMQFLKTCEDDGTTVGINLDPSHLFWRNIDPLIVVQHLSRQLSVCPIKHCHGKDTYVDRHNTAINGCCSAVPYSKERERVWRFVTIGEGWDPVDGSHDLNWWSRFVTELQLWGYDHVISVEHEDSRKSFSEGLGKSLRILEQAINREPPGPLTWTDR